MENSDKIFLYDEEKHQYNLSDTDFKGEIVANTLRENHYDENRVLILRQGNARRGYSKDIDKVCQEYSQHDLKDYLNIYVNRKGLYDILPENMFHQHIYTEDHHSKEEVLDEIRIHREEEFYARRFFRPFEISIDQMLVDFQGMERKMDKMNVYRNYVNVFVKEWPVLELLPLKQAVMLVKILPYIESITASLKKIEQILSILLDIPVHLKEGKRAVTHVDRQMIPPLGKCRLGVDFVLGDNFEDGSSQLVLEIGPISANDLQDFLSGRKGDKILSELKELFLPADRQIVTKYIIRQEDTGFKLGESYLGINTCLTTNNNEMV